LKLISAVALSVVIFSIAIGTTLGLLVQTNQPLDQHFHFTTTAVHTTTPVQCGSIPRNYSNWLEIDTVGNRTGINFQSVTVYTPGLNIRLDIPLNRSAYSAYYPINSTYESIIAPLPDYFQGGELLSISLDYYVSGFAPTSQTLSETPIVDGSMDC
jgi:hypothetical protein